MNSQYTEKKPRTYLTSREVEILHLVAEGNGSKQTASILGISEQVVKNHLTNAFIVLRVQDRTSAVVRALQKCILDLNELRVKEYES